MEQLCRNLPISPGVLFDVLRRGEELAQASARILVYASDLRRAESLCRHIGREAVEKPLLTSSLPRQCGGDCLVLAVVDIAEEKSLRSFFRDAPWRGGGVVVVLGDESAHNRLTWYNRRVARVVLGQPSTDASANSTADVLSLRQVEEAIVQAAGDILVPLARRYPILRDAAARRLILNTSRVNALVAGVLVLPAADITFVLANQMRLIVSLATIYGRQLGPAGFIEAASVLGVGAGLRILLRQAAGLLPGVGWLAKSLLAFASTKALGEAALRLFRDGVLLPACASQITSRS